MYSTWKAVQHSIEWFALKGDGYQFWSGIAGGSPIFVMSYVQWRRHNCHQPWCFRVKFKAHPGDSEHVLCRKHYNAVT